MDRRVELFGRGGKGNVNAFANLARAADMTVDEIRCLAAENRLHLAVSAAQRRRIQRSNRERMMTVLALKDPPPV